MENSITTLGSQPANGGIGNGVKKRSTAAITVIAIALSMLVAKPSAAELYQYTDTEGSLPFTDNPQRVPPQAREKGRHQESFLTEKESKTLKHLMHLDQSNDVAVDNLPQVKKSLNKYADDFKEKYDDIEQTPDSRLSTPEGALRLFIGAMKAGNLADIKASVTSRFWNGLFSQLNSAQVIELSRFFTEHTVVKGRQEGNAAEFDLKEKSGKQYIVGTIKVINLFGNWKIHQM